MLKIALGLILGLTMSVTAHAESYILCTVNSITWAEEGLVCHLQPSEWHQNMITWTSGNPLPVDPSIPSTTLDRPSLSLPSLDIGGTYMMAGGLVSKGQSHAIRVDDQGRVFCSPDAIPEGK